MKPIQERAAGAARGFTLIELLVAMTLLALIVLPVLGRIGESLANSKRRMWDRALAQGLLESMTCEDSKVSSAPGSRDTVIIDGRRFRMLTNSRTVKGGSLSTYSVMVRGAVGWDTLTTVGILRWTETIADSL